MVIENQPLPFVEWLFWSSTSPGALIYWLGCVAALGLGVLAVSFIRTAVLHGPNKAGDIIFTVLRTGFGDLFHTSPRRVMALSWHAIQESNRRQVAVGLVFFVLIVAFAGWFLPVNTTNPAGLYLSFILTTTRLVVLGLALLLSALSLPMDIQNRTIHTVVTKPVRPSEIVLGRTLGFIAIGSMLLVLMGLGSYAFVTRTLSHTHELSEADISTVDPSDGARRTSIKQGRTSLVRGHRHQVALDASGNGVTDRYQSHWHEVTSSQRGGKTVYELGPPMDQLSARIPVYGKLRFKDRGGQDSTTGVNVGNEWTYRSYVEGGTPSAAIWTFKGLRQDDYPAGIRLEMTLRVFRTHKGEIDKGILGSIRLRNPSKPDVTSTFRTFLAKEYYADQHVIPLSFQDDTGRTVDLFDELVSDGELEIEVKCLQRAQFFGVAQPDVYLLPSEGVFWANFVKAHISTWLQMVLVVAFGVMWSTFLNGPVSLLATTCTGLFGHFTPFLLQLAKGKVLGGLAFESIVRIVSQENQMAKLDSTLTNTTALVLDEISRVFLFVVARLLPNFRMMSDTDYVANGFDIPANLLFIHAMTTLGYVVPVLVLGLFLFKIREVAK